MAVAEKAVSHALVTLSLEVLVMSILVLMQLF
jgi:hypothetical protein